MIVLSQRINELGGGLGLIAPQMNRLELNDGCNGCSLGAATLSDAQAKAIADHLNGIMIFSSDIAAALQPYGEDDRQKIITMYLAGGGDARKLQSAQSTLNTSLAPIKGARPYALAWSVVTAASVAVSAYHGYKRNDSVGWAIWWGFMGACFPILTPAIAFAQGISKPKR